jgi:hypothetical protein
VQHLYSIPHETKFTGQADTVERVGRGFGRLVECGIPAIDAVVGLWSQRRRPQRCYLRGTPLVPKDAIAHPSYNSSGLMGTKR